MLYRSSIALALVGTIATTTFADGDDVGVLNVGGQIATVIAEGEPPSQTFGTQRTRVFAADMFFVPSENVVIADEPGFASADWVGGNLGFSFTRQLQEWNGSSFVPSSETISFGSFDLTVPFTATTPASDITTPGHTLNFPAGGLDFHYDARLDGATDTTKFGVYAVFLTLSNPGGSLADSDEIAIIFNHGESETVHDAAIDYAAATIPAPGALGVLAMGGLLAARRRR